MTTMQLFQPGDLVNIVNSRGEIQSPQPVQILGTLGSNGATYYQVEGTSSGFSESELEHANLTLDRALRHAARGHHVLPCEPGGKKPIGALVHNGHLDATTDPEVIRRWWKLYPKANLGIALEQTGWVQIDLDVKSGPDGIADWRDLRAEHKIEDGQALEQSSPSGGAHLFFKANGENPKNCKLAPGVEARGRGYTMVYPSVIDSKPYLWDASSDPLEHDPPEIPDALARLLAQGGPSLDDDLWTSAANAKLPMADPLLDTTPILEGTRDDTLTSIAGHYFAKGHDGKHVKSLLTVINRDYCQPPKPQEDVDRIAESMGRKHRASNGGSQQQPEQQAVPEPDCLLRESDDDKGNANCVRILHDDRYRHTDTHGWLYFNGRFWEKKGTEARLECDIFRTLKRRRHAAVEMNQESIVRVTKGRAYLMEATKRALRSQVWADIDVFDADPDLLNCENGVTNLRTGELFPHDKSQRFTYCIPVEYHPQADFSDWQAWLLEAVGGDRSVFDYLQTAVGYSLTGHTREDCFFYIHGPARAGKGTSVETLLTMLGERPLAAQVDFDTFSDRRSNDSQNFALAPLKPCRLVAASESEESKRMRASKLKLLTGGDYIHCAFKGKDFFNYRPTFKLWLVSNFKINADVDDDAFWCRARVIEFPTSYQGREDRYLKERMKRRENLEAVLAWAVKGSIRWYNMGSRGLQPPQQIHAATQGHRDELDNVGAWLEDCATITNKHDDFTPNALLYQSYETWCHTNGVQPKGRRSSVQALTRKGLVGDRGRVAGNPKVQRGYRGLVL